MDESKILHTDEIISPSSYSFSNMEMRNWSTTTWDAVNKYIFSKIFTIKSN
jgi:hypothetical protein